MTQRSLLLLTCVSLVLTCACEPVALGSVECVTLQKRSCCQQLPRSGNLPCERECCRRDASQPVQQTLLPTHPASERIPGASGFALSLHDPDRRVEVGGDSFETPVAGTSSLVAKHVRLQT